uniref:Uncharacterized protein n=1 Tax=Parascaris equorum TaxID=6256 RepID=A0A914SB36_PAREQ
LISDLVQASKDNSGLDGADDWEAAKIQELFGVTSDLVNHAIPFWITTDENEKVGTSRLIRCNECLYDQEQRCALIVPCIGRV